MHARAAVCAALMLALAASGCRAAADPVAPGAQVTLGLMTTLPIYWGEADDVGELLKSQASAGWVRQALERRFVLEPLDTLDASSLRGMGRLMMAQPRALSPEENVALDGWVRAGGRLLLFADPLLTVHSRFGIGDRRRPQDVVLLSPILSHWGLTLNFDEDQGIDRTRIEIDGTSVPVALAGRFSLAAGSRCAVAADGVLAECRVGKGYVTVFADAALLDDPEDGTAQDRQAALTMLVARAFDRPGI